MVFLSKISNCIKPFKKWIIFYLLYAFQILLVISSCISLLSAYNIGQIFYCFLPRFLQRDKFFLKNSIFLVVNLKQWLCTNNFLELLVEVSCDALTKLNHSAQRICALSWLSLKLCVDFLYGLADQINCSCFIQKFEGDRFETLVVVFGLFKFVINFNIWVKSKLDCVVGLLEYSKHHEDFFRG